MEEIITEWKPKVSVVLPSYNEKENVEEVISRISKSVGGSLHEVIVVDDDSPDGTWKIVNEISKMDKRVKLIHRTKEKGLASALDDGVRAASGNVVVWLDCDLGLPPEDIPRLVSKLDKYDVAIGSRYAKGGRDLRPIWRSLLSVGLNWYSSLLLGWQVRDYTSGFVATRKEVLNYVRWQRNGFGEYFAEFAHQCFRKGFAVTEVGYKFRDRAGGKSKTDGLVRLLSLGWQYGVKILELKFNIKPKILPEHTKPVLSKSKLIN